MTTIWKITVLKRTIYLVISLAIINRDTKLQCSRSKYSLDKKFVCGKKSKMGVASPCQRGETQVFPGTCPFLYFSYPDGLTNTIEYLQGYNIAVSIVSQNWSIMYKTRLPIDCYVRWFTCTMYENTSTLFVSAKSNTSFSSLSLSLD